MELTDTCMLSELTNRINALCGETDRKKLTASFINQLLVEKGYLEETVQGEEKIKRVTEKGRAVGIREEERQAKYGRNYYALIHTRESQQMILEELGNICYSLRQQYNCPLLCVILKQKIKDRTFYEKTGIMTDSHSGILENEASKLGIAVLPMPFYIDEKLYREGVDISREEFYEMLRKGADVATSQPSPESVMHMWSAMLQEYEELVYIPISSGLSGSCMTAQAMAQEEPYAGRVFVVDNGRVSTPMHRSVLDAVELAEKGYRAQKIKDILEKNRQHMVIYVGLSTLTYLKKGGRISSVAAVAADVLKIKPVMKFGVGKLDVYQKCRGMKNARKAMIDAMKKNLRRILGRLMKQENYILWLHQVLPQK